MNSISCGLKVYDGFSKVTVLGKSLAVYKFKLDKLEEIKNEDIIQNSFICYVLWSPGGYDLDRVYVGKSNNGITKRPFSHRDLLDNWEICYVVTDEGSNSYFDESAALFVEDAITNKLRNSNRYKVLTQKTNSNSVHDDKRQICEEFVEDVMDVLGVIGLPSDKIVDYDRIKIAGFRSKFEAYPTGIPCYYSNAKKDTFLAGVYLPDAPRGSNFVVLRCSELCSIDRWAWGARESSDIEKYKNLIENGYIGKDVVLQDFKVTASNALSFACGCVAASPYKRLKTLDGRLLIEELNPIDFVEEVEEASGGIKDDADTDW